MHSCMCLAAAALSLIPQTAMAQEQAQYNPSFEEIERIGSELPQMILHPLYDEPYMCSEHPFSTSMQPGDTLAQDCMIMDGIDWMTNTGFMQFYKGDGSRNEDWFGWGKPVLAPMGGTISVMHRTENVNQPGTMIREMPTYLEIIGSDGAKAIIVHLSDLMVEDGQTVAVGDAIGTVGNNGNSRSPHIHIGAVTVDGQPAQIRWNLVTSALRTRDYVRTRRADTASSEAGE